MRERLSERDNRRDYRTGSLYIYNRTSSPGYVKIGWTSQSVEGRLEEWSKCGYRPNELFRVAGVPYAQRAETLTHHELIKEWRSEQPCETCLAKKGERICHSEWFEVDQERAIKVLSTWAEFFKKAIPYDSDGSLKTGWRRLVEALDANGEKTTATKLLEHHEASIKDKETVTEDPVDMVRIPEIEDQGPILEHTKQEEPVTFQQRRTSICARLEALTSPKAQLEEETLPLYAPLTGGFLRKVEEQRKIDLPISPTPLLKFELAALEPCTGGSLSKSQPTSWISTEKRSTPQQWEMWGLQERWTAL